MDPLTLKDFAYNLPDELIAQEPLSDRSSSRLIVRTADGQLSHHRFAELAELLPAKTHLVFNDTRVIPGRLFASTEHGGRVELMLLKPLDPTQNRWQAIGKPFRKLQRGKSFKLDHLCTFTVEAQLSEQAQPMLEVSFNLPYGEFLEWMDGSGYVPLPPYINRKAAQAAPLSEDRERYQTVYASEKGSVAAPTAGLHFSEDLWKRLLSKGITPVPLTLHVGGGTFLPVKTPDLEQHAMHKESYRISHESWQSIARAHAEGLPIVVVGTTSLRCLESFARRAQLEEPSKLTDRWMETDLFLYPRHRNDRIKPWGVSALITNFHQPESSLLMLVAALISYQGMQDLYRSAIAERYRFFSYGDASLLWLE